MLSKLKSKFLTLKELISLRNDDILIVSFPKSGNTWVRLILANLLSQKYLDGKQIHSFELNNFLPETGRRNIYDWKFACQRLIKSHKKNNLFFKNKKIIYILRDPRDVMVSYYYYNKNSKNSEKLSKSQLIRHKEKGAKALEKHVDSYLNHKKICFIKYENLKKKPIAEVKKVINFIGFDFSDKEIKNAIEYSDFKNVKKDSKNNQPNQRLLKKGASFLRKGTINQWKKELSKKDIQYTKNNCKKVLDKFY